MKFEIIQISLRKTGTNEAFVNQRRPPTWSTRRQEPVAGKSHLARNSKTRENNPTETSKKHLNLLFYC